MTVQAGEISYTTQKGRINCPGNMSEGNVFGRICPGEMSDAKMLGSVGPSFVFISRERHYFVVKSSFKNLGVDQHYIYPQIQSWSVTSAACRLALAGRSRTCAVQARCNSTPVSATQSPAVPD